MKRQYKAHYYQVKPSDKNLDKWRTFLGLAGLFLAKKELMSVLGSSKLVGALCLEAEVFSTSRYSLNNSSTYN